MDATFSWYFRDEDRWLTVESRTGRVNVRPGLTEDAEMKFYSSCVADFIHQHTTEGAGRAIFQGGGFQIYYQPTRAGWIDDRLTRVMASVARLRAHKVPVVISTGRGIAAAMPVVRHLGLSAGWMVCANGAMTLRLDPDAPGGFSATLQKVQVADVVEDPTKVIVEHDPSHRHADVNGNVTLVLSSSARATEVPPDVSSQAVLGPGLDPLSGMSHLFGVKIRAERVADQAETVSATAAAEEA